MSSSHLNETMNSRFQLHSLIPDFQLKAEEVKCITFITIHVVALSTCLNLHLSCFIFYFISCGRPSHCFLKNKIFSSCHIWESKNISNQLQVQTYMWLWQVSLILLPLLLFSYSSIFLHWNSRMRMFSIFHASFRWNVLTSSKGPGIRGIMTSW